MLNFFGRVLEIFGRVLDLYWSPNFGPPKLEDQFWRTSFGLGLN